MIETHIVNALLRPEIKDGLVFKVLTFINGLVAPSFLFCAGFALSIMLRRRWNEFIHLRRSLWRYSTRLFFILIVGYCLHLPFFSLKRLLAIEDDRLWIPFYQADILHTIAVTLLILILLLLISRKQKIFIGVSLIFALVFVFLAPIIRELDYSTSLVWFRPYLTANYKSQFPLFPWSGFLTVGMVIGYYYMKVQGSRMERGLMKKIGYTSLLVILLALIVEFLPLQIYPNHDFWRASPEFFFVRLGLVVLFLFLLWLYEQNRKVSPQSVFSIFGQESLLVYVVHLLVVYGYTFEWSFIRYYGPTQSYAGSFVLFALLTLVMYAMAYGWHWLKNWNLKIAKGVQFTTLSIIAITFLMKEM